MTGAAAPAPGGPAAGRTAARRPRPRQPIDCSRRLADLVLPLATLLGLAERPGEGYGLGPLDPALCRELAITAAGSPYSRLCVTVTDPDGIAIGHGCARASRRGQPRRPAGTAAPPSTRPGPDTVPRRCRPVEPDDHRRPPGGTGQNNRAAGPGILGLHPRHRSRTARTGTAPGRLPCPTAGTSPWNCEPVPTFECDHRYESHAYQPNDTLRHLVQIRDGDCTFPPCSRHAREADFEHAIPYDKGGRTCACNAGARSRACHRVKQSPGWNVTQPRPGWHQWETPSGRTYIQGPKRYPVNPAWRHRGQPTHGAQMG